MNTARDLQATTDRTEEWAWGFFLSRDAGTMLQAAQAVRHREIGIWFLELARRVEANEMGPAGLALTLWPQAPDQ